MRDYFSAINKPFCFKSSPYKNAQACGFAYRSYKILTHVRIFLRGQEYDNVMSLSELGVIDDLVTAPNESQKGACERNAEK